MPLVFTLYSDKVKYRFIALTFEMKHNTAQMKLN